MNGQTGRSATHGMNMKFHPEFNKKLVELLSVGESFKGTQAGTDDRILDAEGLLLKFAYHQTLPILFLPYHQMYE